MLRMHPLTVAEQERRSVRPLVDRVAAGEPLAAASEKPPDLLGYLERALRGGFPEPALELGQSTARAWLESYADQVALRDARSYGVMPDASRLQRYLQSYATNSATAAHHKTLYDAAGVSRKTALGYDALLLDLMVVDELPAWSTNRLKRLSRTPKRYVMDSGLLGGILRVGIDDVMADSSLLGAMIETFVVAQLRAEAAVSKTRYRLAHLREQDGRREVDVIAELGGGRVVGVEVKAAASVGRSDARHLVWLGQALADRFAGGVVLHTGRDTYELADSIIAAPISALWT